MILRTQVIQDKTKENKDGRAGGKAMWPDKEKSLGLKKILALRRRKTKIIIKQNHFES